MKICEFCHRGFLPLRNQVVCNRCIKLSKGTLCKQCGTRFNPSAIKDKRRRKKKICPECFYINSGIKNHQKKINCYPPGFGPTEKPISYTKAKISVVKKKDKIYQKYPKNWLKLRFKILARDKFTCQYCGRQPSDGIKLSVDHKNPLINGGENGEENLITACMDCNIGKGISIVKS